MVVFAGDRVKAFVFGRNCGDQRRVSEEGLVVQHVAESPSEDDQLCDYGESAAPVVSHSDEAEAAPRASRLHHRAMYGS